MPKSELGASQLDRLGMMGTAGDEGKGRGDGEQLLTDRLKNSDHGVIHCYNRRPKSELGASRLDRLDTKVIAGDEGKGREEGERVPGEYWRAGGHKGMAPWEMIAGSVVMLNTHYRTCNLTPKHVYGISHMHFTCTLSSKNDMLVKCECLCVLNSAGGQQCRENRCGVRAKLCEKDRKHRLVGPAFSSDNAGDGPTITTIAKKIICIGKNT